MARQHTWLGAASALPAFLLAGCLFHGKLDSQSAATGKKEGVAVASSLLPKELDKGGAPEPPPEPVSNYRPRVVSPLPRQAASLEPVAAQAPESARGTTVPLLAPGGATAEKANLHAKVELKPASLSKPASPGGSESSIPPEAPLVTALRCAMDKHPQEARQLLTKYEKTDRELLLALLHLTAGIGEGELAKLTPEEVSATLDQLAAVTAHLRQRAPLALENVCFCQKIEGFGRYEPLPATCEFQAGSDGRPGERLQVYAEVRNFSCRPEKGQYETVLQSTLEIRDAERRKLTSMELGRCVDHSQTPRQDYFLNFQLHVPAKLPPGLYTLWVTVKDVTPGDPAASGNAREASCSLDFKVCAPGARPAGP